MQAETCHFDRVFGPECAAPLTPFLCNNLEDSALQNFANCTQRVTSLTEICVCGYRDGSRECIPCEWGDGCMIVEIAKLTEVDIDVRTLESDM